MRLRLTASAALLTLVAACSTTSRQSVPMPALDAAVAPDACRVYVVRDGLVLGTLKGVRVMDGEREVGVLEADGFLCWDRPAQRGVGLAIFEGYRLDGGPVESVFDLPREGGSTTWFAIRLRGEDRKPIVEALDPDEGRASVAAREPAVVE